MRNTTQKSRTVTGKLFEYSGSLATGIVVYFKDTQAKISTDTIKIIRQEIKERSPVLMGANRKPLVADSVGETLYLEHRVSPQAMSYVLPLLVEEGFCTVNDKKPFMIRKN